MRRDLRTYLWDLQRALSEIEGFISGKSFDDYLRERILQRALEREFIIIGEVISRIVYHFPETKTRIDDARRIANFRNVLVHEYAMVEAELVWKVVTVSAPVLKTQVDRWAEELDQR